MSKDNIVTEESKPKEIDKPVKPNASVIKAYNKSRRNIELDFGRDKEVRVAAFETVEISASLLKHPAFIAEAANFDILTK